DPPRADDDSRGDGARILRPSSGARGVGLGHEAASLPHPARQPLLPVGGAAGPGATPAADRGRRAGGQAGHPGRRHRRAGDEHRQAAALPCPGAARGLVCPRAPLRDRGLPAAMTTASTLLAFVALAATLLLVWRQSWRGRVRLFVVQSCVLATLAVVIGLLAHRPALVVVGVVFAIAKTWIIPRVLHRMGVGSPLRRVAPGRSEGLSVLAAGALVVVAYVVMLPITGVVAAGVPTRSAMPLALAMALIGLFVCVTGRDALGQVIGFLVFENGVFALALL